jgi:hypothetical protein
MTTDGGCKLVIDGVTFRDDPATHSVVTQTVTVHFTQEGFHRIVFTYFDDFGPAVAKLSWKKGGCNVEVSDGQWKGEYFANETLSGDPIAVRDDGNGDLDFDFGSGSPSAACGIPIDHFSVRWTRNVYFKPGIVTFTVTADDGVRLFVDGVRVLDEWHTTLVARIYTVNVPVTMGTHAIRLDYFDQRDVAVAKLKW